MDINKMKMDIEDKEKDALQATQHNAKDLDLEAIRRLGSLLSQEEGRGLNPQMAMAKEPPVPVSSTPPVQDVQDEESSELDKVLGFNTKALKQFQEGFGGKKLEIPADLNEEKE